MTDNRNVLTDDIHNFINGEVDANTFAFLEFLRFLLRMAIKCVFDGKNNGKAGFSLLQ